MLEVWGKPAVPVKVLSQLWPSESRTSPLGIVSDLPAGSDVKELSENHSNHDYFHYVDNFIYRHKKFTIAYYLREKQQRHVALGSFGESAQQSLRTKIA